MGVWERLTQFGESRSGHPWLPKLRRMYDEPGRRVRLDGNKLTLSFPYAESEVTWVPRLSRTLDGQIVEGVFQVRTLFPKLNDLPDQDRVFGAINAFAVLGAAMPKRAWDPVQVRSRLTFFRGDEHTAPLMLRIIYVAMQAGGSVFLDQLGQTIRAPREGLSGPLRTEGPSEFSDTELKAAGELLRRVGGNVRVHPRIVSAALGFEAIGELAPNGIAHGTVHLHATDGHPDLGAGLMVNLMVPSLADPGKEASMAARLNEWEADAVDHPPMFGAWCPGAEPGMLAFVSFLPNYLRLPGIVDNFAIWALHRMKLVAHERPNL